MTSFTVLGGGGDPWIHRIGLDKIIILSFLPVYFLTILNNSAHYSHLVDPLFSIMLKRKKKNKKIDDCTKYIIIEFRPCYCIV